MPTPRVTLSLSLTYAQIFGTQAKKRFIKEKSDYSTSAANIANMKISARRGKPEF